jgi:hypothetical protein
MVRPTKARRLGSIADLSVKEFRSQPSISTRPSPTDREVEIGDLKVTQLDHPKVPRQKLDPKYPLTLEKMALPKILEQENREFPRVSTRVVLEQFGKPEKKAPYPPRKATKSPVRGKKVSTRLRRSKSLSDTRKPDEPKNDSAKIQPKDL